jgi:hypothetical protein
VPPDVAASPAEVAVARYNARQRHEVHWLTTATLVTMGKYDRPVGIGPLITVDTTVPVDVASVAAEVRRLHGPDTTSRAVHSRMPMSKLSGRRNSRASGKRPGF